jgi:hypothetical protein
MDNHKKETGRDPYMSQLIAELMFTQYESEGRLLDFKISSSDSSQLQKEFGGLPKLVFFHSELNCNSCVEENLSFLNSLGNIIGNENILFLASYRSKRDLTIFKRINQIKYHTYNVPSVGLPIEKLNYPFCFIINMDRKAECVFIPIKEDSLYFKRDLEMIKNKYFDKIK